MKVVKLKCPNCNADLEVNEELENAVCNYCGNTFKVEDERETEEERIIKAISKKEEKDRKYYASEDYEKKLKVEAEANDKSVVGTIGRIIDKERKYRNSEEYKLKQEKKKQEDKKTLIVLGIIFGSIAIVVIILLATAKSRSSTCYLEDKKYYLTYEKNGKIKCASCTDEMLNELNEKYNDPESLSNTESNIESYFVNLGGYCGFKQE